MKIYLNLFLAGISLGWGPCFWFCAPILLPYIAATQKGWRQGFKVSLAFSLARITSYVILSLISAGLGAYLVSRFYESQQGLIIQIIAGAFICLLGLIIVIGRLPQLHFCLPFKKTGACSIKEVILLGILVGLAPCLPLLGILGIIAFHAQGLLQGASLGLVFGLGTLLSPLILGGVLAGEAAGLLLKKPLAHKIISRACGGVLLYFGIGMLIGAL